MTELTIMKMNLAGAFVGPNLEHRRRHVEAFERNKISQIQIAQGAARIA